MQEENVEITFGNIVRLTFLSESEPEVYYICQPSQVQQRIMQTAQKQSNPATTQATKVASGGSSNGSKWSTDDH